MQDKQVEELMTDYAERLGHFEGTVQERRRSTPYWRPVAVTASGLALVAVLVFTPRQAEAAPMEKVATALGKVDYWRADSWIKSRATTRTQDWGLHSVQTYWNGVSQFESRYNAQHKLILTVEGGSEFYDVDTAPYISKWPFDSKAYGESIQDPMKHALGITRGRSEALKRTDQPAYQGQSAYALTLTDAKGDTQFKVIVAKSTDLPLFVTMKLRDNGGLVYEYKSEYRYDPPAGQSGLRIASKEVIDCMALMATVKEKWSAVSAPKGKPLAYEASYTSDGSIWVAYASSAKDAGFAPSGIKGLPYIRGATYAMTSPRSDKPFLVHGKGVSVTRFLPLSDHPSLPASITVTSGRKGVAPQSVAMTPKRERYEFPGYFPAFRPYHYPEIEEMSKLTSIALHWAEKRDYKRAVAVFDRYFALAAKQVNYRPGPFVYAQAALSYEKVGNQARALQLRRLAGKGS